MNTTWFEALVVILSVMLALFLLLSIILLVRFIQISKQVKRIVDQAEEIADKAEEITTFFEKTATPVAILKLVANVSDRVVKTADKFNKKRKK